VEVRDRKGKFWGEARGYACGSVVKGSNTRPFGDKEPVKIHILSEAQVERRDENVDKKTVKLREKHPRDPARADREIEAMAMSHGSRGRSEFARSGLHYWHATLGHPVAVYHTTYLGPAKDMMRWLTLRLGVGDKPKDDLVLPLSNRNALRSLMCARVMHFVLRNKADCIMVNFTAHLGQMTMSEMQLLYEVGMPYLVHDLWHFDVHQAVGVMLLLLRHGMLCYTRLLCHDKEEYMAQLKLGQACLFAYGAIAEHFHDKVENGLSQFPFTWKLHKLQHVTDQLLARGFTLDSSDAWVERLMRQKASMIVKCAVPIVLLYSCIGC
jgi:hypothetical protein